MDAGIVALLLGVGTAVLTPVGVAVGKFFSQAIQLQTLKLGNQKTGEIETIVKLAVSSAQQMKNSGQISDKKTFALGLANKILEQKKIKGVDNEVLSAIIEASVWDNINSPAASVSVIPSPVIMGAVVPVSSDDPVNTGNPTSTYTRRGQ